MDIMFHLTCNFYPPIPHDIQRSCQEFFDVLRASGNWTDGEEYFIDNEDVLDMEWSLPNGATVTGRQMLDELRLWDALYVEEELA